jgi:undecaprenyl diphosphate synthase
VPQHVAIIMDGNGRWARSRGKPRLAGHRAGTENIRRVIERFAAYDVAYLTLYAFSTENWERPRWEVRGLMALLSRFLKQETQNLHKEGIRLVHIGDLSPLNANLRRQVLDAIELTRHNTRMTLAIAFNYGGRAEIVGAVQRIVADGVPADAIDEELIERYLSTHGLPDPDLIIRTAGELRLSNFLLWQGAYAEFCFTEVYWPDFDIEHIDEALDAYSQRRRRFGGLDSDVGHGQNVGQGPSPDRTTRGHPPKAASPGPSHSNGKKSIAARIFGNGHKP